MVIVSRVLPRHAQPSTSAQGRRAAQVGTKLLCGVCLTFVASHLRPGFVTPRLEPRIGARHAFTPAALTSVQQTGVELASSVAEESGQEDAALTPHHSDDKDEHGEPEPSERVFVRGFDAGATEEDLVYHFKKAGPVEYVRVLGGGKCIVTFGFVEAAQAAVELLNGTKIGDQSRTIEVCFFRQTPRIRKKPSTKPRGKPPGERALQVWVSGFDGDTTEVQLRRHFQAAGDVQSVKIEKGDSGQANAWVTFNAIGEAEKAVETLHRTRIPGTGRYMSVTAKKPRKRQKKKKTSEMEDSDFDGLLAGDGFVVVDA